MNLLLYAPQMAAYGGMERHVCGVAALMAARGHRVVLLTTSHSLGAPLRQELDRAGVRLCELPLARGRAPAVVKLLWLQWQLRRLRGVAWDVIYTNGQSALARHVWKAARPGARRVHHHHTAADEAERRTWSAGFRRVLAEAGELVACSESTARAMTESLPGKDVLFLPYLTASPVSASDVQEREPGADGPLRFGFVGRLIPEKGVDRVIRLACEPALSDVTWHVHGAGAAYPPECFAGTPRLIYHGAYAGEAEHAAVLRSLDAVILPSTHNEGMPLSLIEGMSAGLPWVATDQGGTREIALEPDCARLVSSDGDDAALVAAVRTLADAIRSGTASRRKQRAAYDRVFAPAVVGPRWAEFLERSGAGSTAAVWAGNPNRAPSSR
jgi:glycosyltransferase involved in cell wall biosynthesis